MRFPPPPDSSCTRRGFVARTVLGAGAGVLAGCGLFEPKAKDPTGAAVSRSRLVSRPSSLASAPRQRLEPGLRPLDPETTPEVLLYVPNGYSPDRPAPLAVALHGAGMSDRSAVAPWLPYADALGLVLLAPQALGTTWDFIWGTYGVDVAAIDRALAKVFRDVAVDPARVSLTGFSDGASYALSLGLTNGDLFTRLVAFSPGILAPAAYNGKPAVFVSHGTRDQILSIDRCSRRFVPKLRGDGYAVTYREFDGPHTVPPNIAEEAARFVASV